MPYISAHSLWSRSPNATISLSPRSRGKTILLHGMHLRKLPCPCRLIRRPYRPSLISQLVNAINTSIEGRYNNTIPNAAVILRRSLQLLNAVLKEYAAFKMLTGVKTMGQVRQLRQPGPTVAEPLQLVEDLRIPMQAHYARLTSTLPSITPATLGQVNVAEDILLAHLSFKCLVKMTFWAYHRYSCCRDYREYEPWV